jgi:hypothetical protein
MSCRRIRRELIERFRFGELDARSAPHLAHLNGCVGCRDEVGIERSVVHHLQRALAERVVDRDPSPNAFEGIRRRALEPATPSWGDGLWRWARALPAGAAIALMGFAILSGSSAVPNAPQPRITWPGFEERAPFDPVHSEGLWIEGYLVPSPPTSGLSAYVDRTQLPSRPPIGTVSQGITK